MRGQAWRDPARTGRGPGGRRVWRQPRRRTRRSKAARPSALDGSVTPAGLRAPACRQPCSFARRLARRRAGRLCRGLGCCALIPSAPRSRFISAPGERLSGTFDGLEPDGALRLRLDDGRVERIRAGDVTLANRVLAALGRAMLLAIDAGNTNVVFAFVDGEGSIRTRWRIATDPRRTADEYAVWLHQLLAMEGFAKADVAQVIIGTVVPARAAQSDRACAEIFRPRPGGRRAGRAGRSHSTCPSPKRVGADRALNAIAGHARHQGDLIVVDFGTATTFDVVDFSGAYKGGIIAPGINLSLDALVSAAAKLPRIAIAAPGRQAVIGAHDRDADADRRLLGLCRDDRGAGGAAEGRDRSSGAGSLPPAAWPSCSTKIPTRST